MKRKGDIAGADSGAVASGTARWLQALKLLSLLSLWALSLALAWTQHSLLYAFGLTGLVSLGFVRPRIGAYLFISLASVDLLANVDVGHFTLRSAQLVMLAAFVGRALQSMAAGDLRRQLRKIPRAWWFFAGFSALAALHLLSAEILNPVKGLAYFAWSVFSALVMGLGLVWVLDGRAYLKTAMRVLVYGSDAVALFGLLQWSMSLAGLDPPLVTQWMRGLARINGLSFEPSYFAFAMSLALSLALGSLLSRRPFLPVWPSALSAALFVVVIALSSSRSGWIALLLVALAFLLALWPSRSLLAARWRALALVPLSYALALSLLLLVSPDQYGRMARNGVNLHEKSSSAPRIQGVVDALQLAREHPLWGVGLGQFGAALTHKKGQQLDARHIDARVTFNLYAELLVENGILGLGLIVTALLALAWALWRLWRGRRDDELSSWAGVLLLASLLHFGVMAQFNQTFFRSDIWHLLGLVMALLSVAAARPQPDVVN